MSHVFYIKRLWPETVPVGRLDLRRCLNFSGSSMKFRVPQDDDEEDGEGEEFFKAETRSFDDSTAADFSFTSSASAKNAQSADSTILHDLLPSLENLQLIYQSPRYIFIRPFSSRHNVKGIKLFDWKPFWTKRGRDLGGGTRQAAAVINAN